MCASPSRSAAELWLLTAEADLKAAEALTSQGTHAAACFWAHQCGEAAGKALWVWAGQQPRTHSVLRLLRECPPAAHAGDLGTLFQAGRRLDQLYVPTRYPSALPDLTPADVYDETDSARAMAAAREIVSACRRWLEVRGVAPEAR